MDPHFQKEQCPALTPHQRVCLFLQRGVHWAVLQPGNCSAISWECLYPLTCAGVFLSPNGSTRADQRPLVEGGVFQRAGPAGPHRACIHAIKNAPSIVKLFCLAWICKRLLTEHMRTQKQTYHPVSTEAASEPHSAWGEMIKDHRAVIMPERESLPQMNTWWI